MSGFNVDEIMRILPHRHPILLVDRILECDLEKKRIVGIKNVTATEPHFTGHFPGHPVMPGVLQLESMAQVAGILLNKLSGREGRIAYFTSIDAVRFRRMVIPGDQLYIEVDFVKAKLNMAKVIGRISISGELVTEAELMFSFERD